MLPPYQQGNICNINVKVNYQVSKEKSLSGMPRLLFGRLFRVLVGVREDKNFIT